MKNTYIITIFVTQTSFSLATAWISRHLNINVPDCIVMATSSQYPFTIIRTPRAISKLHAHLVINDCSIETWLRLQNSNWWTAMDILMLPYIHLHASQKLREEEGRVKNEANLLGCNSGLPASQFGHALCRHNHRNGHRTLLVFQDGLVYKHIPAW